MRAKRQPRERNSGGFALQTQIRDLHFDLIDVLVRPGLRLKFADLSSFPFTERSSRFYYTYHPVFITGVIFNRKFTAVHARIPCILHTIVHLYAMLRYISWRGEVSREKYTPSEK